MRRKQKLTRTINRQQLATNSICSTFLNEKKYSTNEPEFLTVVYFLEHNKYYLYGSKFELQTDHQALPSALKTTDEIKDTKVV